MVGEGLFGRERESKSKTISRRRWQRRRAAGTIERRLPKDANGRSKPDPWAYPVYCVYIYIQGKIIGCAAIFSSRWILSGPDGTEEESLGKSISPIGFAESSTGLLQKLTPKRAAVLVCLFEGDAGDVRVFLTKRSSRLSTHFGEVSLPGGKGEEGNKDDADTATREAKEEIGLDPSLVNVVTHLQPFLSKHLLKVTPVIGILHEKEKFNPVLNEDEVDTIFDCPLEMFLKGKPAVLKYVKFQNVRSLTIFIEDNQSAEDITKIQKIGLFGSTVETTDMKGLKKIEDN